MSSTTRREIPPGWAHNPKGFVVEDGDRVLKASCQRITRTSEEGNHHACGNRGRYARTLWNAMVVFSCGTHLDAVEDYARPNVVMGSRGAAVMVTSQLPDRPHYLWVPGAVEPAEHPVHVPLEPEPGRVECWCGALQKENEHGTTFWEGGRPTDKPWWDRQREQRLEAASSREEQKR